MEEERKKWVIWGRICKPIAEGGLGIRTLKEMQKALQVKFAWKLMHEYLLWANFFRKKICWKQTFDVTWASKGYKVLAYNC